jgi:hypothetical protein
MTETEKEDLPEVLREEDVGTVDIKAIHFQLRRLLKDSNFSDGIVLTAIPEQKSKVMFTFENDATKLFSPVSARSGSRVKRSSSARTEKDKDSRRPSLARHVSHDPPRNADDKVLETNDNPFDAAPKPKLLRQRSINKEAPEEVPYKKSRDKVHHKHSIGYIMFECGLEDILITAVRRLGYKDKNAPDIVYQSDDLEESVNETQMKTKSEVEGSSSSRESKSKGQGDKASGSSTKGQGHSTQGQKQAGQTSSPVSQSKTSTLSNKGTIQVGLDPLGVGNVKMYTSSNSVHSWDSRISIPSDSGDLADTSMLEGDASSGVLHLKTIWFNFAAPPPLPIKRKADFTK